MVALQEVIDRIDDLFGDEDFTPGQEESFVEGAMTVLLENDVLHTQAAVNTTTQFAESPDLKDEFLSSVSDNQGAHAKIVDFFFSDSPQVDVVIGAFTKAFHAAVQDLGKTA